MTLDEAIRMMTDEIASVIAGDGPTIYLFGSVALGDFKLGWSDIDIAVLTDQKITGQQADALVTLRQDLLERYPGNPYFRLFEGGMLTKKAFFAGEKDTVVYWGTSGQRVTDAWGVDSFATAELRENGVLLRGGDVREKMTYPTHEQFKDDIRRHCGSIRRYGTHGWGWLLDISRGLYTLQTDRVISKTAAGEWALETGICPDEEALQRAVEVRRFPLELKDREDYREYAGHTGGAIQRFADVLERELEE